MIAVSQVLAAPCIAGVLLAPSPHVSYGLLFLAYVTAETWLGPAAAIVQVLYIVVVVVVDDDLGQCPESCNGTVLNKGNCFLM